MQSVWIGIWSWFGGSWSGIKMKKWEKLQKRVEKPCFSILHEHAKNSHNRVNWNRMDFGCNTPREKWKLISHDHVKILHSHAKRSKKTKMVLMDFPLRIIVRNCIFSRFLDEETSGRPLRWCQVPTWPWPINRNLIYSFKDFWYISNFRTFQISSFCIILYFPSFSLIFSIAEHVLWDQISKHEWLNLIFLRGGRI